MVQQLHPSPLGPLDTGNKVGGASWQLRDVYRQARRRHGVPSLRLAWIRRPVLDAAGQPPPRGTTGVPTCPDKCSAVTNNWEAQARWWLCYP